MKRKLLMVTILMLSMLMGLLPAMLFVAPVSAAPLSWSLEDCMPTAGLWVEVEPDHYEATATRLGDRRFRFEADCPYTEFGRWETDIKMDSHPYFMYFETTCSQYGFYLEGESKNTQETVRFGWFMNLTVSYRFLQWYYKYEFYRVDQDENVNRIWFGESVNNYVTDIVIEVSKSASTDYYTKVTTTYNGNPITNTIYDYIEEPLLVREFDQPSTTALSGVEGWSATDDVIRSYDLLVGKAGAGYTQPSMGWYRYPAGDWTPEFRPIPDQGWYFHHWEVNGEPISPYIEWLSLHMVEDYYAMASFYVNGGGGCPLVYTYNGTDFVYDGLIALYNEESPYEDMIVEYLLTEEPVKENGFYKILFDEYPTTTSHLDQVKLYGILPNEQRVLLPMTSAIHSVDGDVTQDLKFSDDIKVDVVGVEQGDAFFSEQVDFLFSGIPQEFIDFIFVVEGFNGPKKE